MEVTIMHKSVEWDLNPGMVITKQAEVQDLVHTMQMKRYLSKYYL